MVKLFYFVFVLVLCLFFAVGCCDSEILIETKLDVKKIESVKDNNYILWIRDEETKDLRKLFLDSYYCQVLIKDDIEKGAPVYAEAWYKKNGSERSYKKVIVHIHSASEINGIIENE